MDRRAPREGSVLKLHYYAETDSLYIDLADRPGSESREVADGVVLDFDTEGRLVGIDIDHASRIVDLGRIEANELPLGRIAVGSG